MYQSFAGIDISKDCLAVAVLENGDYRQQFSVPNSTAGHREIASRLAVCAQPLIAFEATSNYGLDLALFLSGQPGFTVAQLNPRQARSFQDASMTRAKTDPLDARGLALFAQRMLPQPWSAPSAAALALRSLGRRLAELVAARSAEQCRLKAAASSQSFSLIVESSRRMIACINAEIELIEQEAQALLNADPQLCRAFAILSSLKGVALRSGTQILGELACLPPDMDKRQWVSFFGLDPLARESGSSLKAARHISRRGSPNMRRVLFMSALVACRFEPAVEQWDQSLVERGKPKRLAHTAVMRKLLCAFWGMLRNDEAFDPEKFRPRG